MSRRDEGAIRWSAAGAVGAAVAFLCVALAALATAAPARQAPDRSAPARAPGPDAAAERLAGDGAERGQGPDFVPGEVIVRFRSGADRTDRTAARSVAGARRALGVAVPRAQRLRIRGAGGPRQVARELERLPGVAYAEPNWYVHATETPSDPDLAELWGLHNGGQVVRRQSGAAGADISALDAWEITTGDPEVTVAVVDTGVDPTHPDLAANLVGGGRDLVDDDADPADENGHGTHVAGTIGAVGDNGIGVSGVAWDVGLMAVRVLGADGTGTVADVAAGFEYAADRDADIVNASLGADSHSDLIDDAIAAAPETLFVVAAGNGGDDGIGDDNEVEPQYPCNSPHPNVVCVAATDSRDRLAGFSNHGGESVDLAAPGVDVYSTAAAGVRREHFFAGFERPLEAQWLSGESSAAGSWGTVPTPRFSGDRSLADSPGADYQPGADARIAGPAVDLEGASGCELDFWLRTQIPDPDDALVVDGSTGGGAWAPLDPRGWSGAGQGFAGEDASQLDGAPEARIGFRMSSDADGLVGAGAHVDHASLVCLGAEPGYDFLSGTSMATPHVAGAAALIRARRPGSSVADLTGALRGGVDEVPALDGLVATGGRLNARRSLVLATDTTSPKTRWRMRPPPRTRRLVNRFRFVSDEPGASFRCQFNRGPWRSCSSPRRYRRLKQGRHVFRLQAVDAAGNRSPRRVWGFRVLR